jgi:hypothetical protein
MVDPIECIVDIDQDLKKPCSELVKTKLNVLKHDLMQVRDCQPIDENLRNNGYKSKAMKKSLEFLREVYNNPDEKIANRIHAAVSCLPYEYHRLPQKIDINADVNVHGVFGHMIRAVGISDLEGQVVDELAKEELEAIDFKEESD